MFYAIYIVSVTPTTHTVTHIGEAFFVGGARYEREEGEGVGTGIKENKRQKNLYGWNIGISCALSRSVGLIFPKLFSMFFF